MAPYKNKTKTKNKTNQDRIDALVDLKYRFDLLSNELFHLKEYISLIEFDPTHKNETDSFNKFLNREHLSINENNEEEIPSTDGSRGIRVRRHQLRTKSSHSTNATNDSSTNTPSIEELEILVQDKYKELQSGLKSYNISIKQEKNIQNNIPKKTNINNKTLKKPVKKVEPKKTLKRKYNSFKKEENEVIQPKEEIEDDNLVLHGNTDGEDEYYFTTSSEEELELQSRKERNKRPHVNITFSKPKQTITNPLHVIKPKYDSLAEYLASFKSLDDDMTTEEYYGFIKEQRYLSQQIKKGLENGILKYDEESNYIQPVITKDARYGLMHKPDPISYIYKEQHKHTYQDYLINQSVHMSRLFQNSKKARIARAKKVSQMIEQHFKHIAGAEERKIREEEKQKRAMNRTILQALKKRWNLAERAYRVLKKDEEEQLKRIQGKKHLSKILEQSTQLLGAQLNQGIDDIDDSELESENNGSDKSSLGSSSDGDSDEDDILSSSSEEEKEEEEQKLKIELLNEDKSKRDESLTVNDLRKKYVTLTDVGSADEILDESDNHSNTFIDVENETTGTISSEESNLDENNAPGLSALFANEYNDADNQESLSEESEDYELSGSDEDISMSDSEDENRQDICNDIDSKDIENEDAKIIRNGNEENDSNIFEPHAEQLRVIDVPIPPLLRGTLRIYQKQGLNWLASLYNNNTNGILADEMGLGKTIQTISLLAHLACEKENWGPHLIVVPTSVLLNWEMEFKRFAPGLKVLTYYGSPQQRKEKRKGWNKQDAFHVCIVSYQLVVQDQHSFKRKKWEYMILDEAHNIKNFRSTRWQALLNFNTRRRLLLTGTPLQNNLAELWSLLYFLMPQTVVNGKKVSGFADLEAFQQWFGHPVDKIIETTGGVQDEETKKTVAKLHQVLRPYLLRRLKADVEKQMPAKYEHIVYCRLSKRQRYLYDDFMARSKTKETLASGNFMSIVNCLMQLRKVCNHPDLFEVRPILTSFESGNSVMHDYSNMNRTISKMVHRNDYDSTVDKHTLNLVFSRNDLSLEKHRSEEISKLSSVKQFISDINSLRKQIPAEESVSKSLISNQDANKFFKYFGEQRIERKLDSIKFQKYINDLRCDKHPVYGQNLVNLLTIGGKTESELVKPLIAPLQTRFLKEKELIDEFAVLTPKAVTLDSRPLTLALDDDSLVDESSRMALQSKFHNMDNPFHHLQTKLTIAFPDKSLLQYDCGKLQKLATLLQNLKDNGHRALIFTQMTKVLDILEQFLNIHGYLYMRLDGATKVEDRQILTERFNSDNKITVFILSSRSGGLGINLTGADTVIFYDSDWNPAMDKQCQDRCHRIGQTRDVHIYRFVSDHTIESNILKKANQKRQLDNVVIQEGDFTTDYFSKLSIGDLLGTESAGGVVTDDRPLLENGSDVSKNPKHLEKILAQAEDEDDVRAANLAMKEVEIDDEDFTEDITQDDKSKKKEVVDEYEGTSHVEEYMIRLIANGYYY